MVGVKRDGFLTHDDNVDLDTGRLDFTTLEELSEELVGQVNKSFFPRVHNMLR